jgi:hypothetical protein
MNNFDPDLIDALFNRPMPPAPPPDPPMPAIRGKQIDGELWLNAADVADALEQQAPKAARKFINKVRAALNG